MLTAHDQKSIAFLGDSITLGYGLSDPSLRYSTLICKEYGIREENYGITGTLIANAGVSRGKGISFVERVSLVEQADLAVVFGGTNDYFWSDCPIRAPKGAEDSTEYFETAVDRLLRFCAEHRPKGKTLIVTPYPHHGVGNYSGAP
ncbi:MAG: SGNH/GDSL hydrolase family protein, partial [Clostridia bacterium]|nr:SGNH/GDSL hydrolase family protein [Clostridia bacterium]